MNERGQIIRLQRITRQMVQADRHTIFVFGDNMQGRGFGGQAKEMRGEPNTIGVPTKWAPGRGARDYFTPDDWQNRDVYHAVAGAFQLIEQALAEGRNVAIPSDGLGTGLAELPKRCPKLAEFIENSIQSADQKGGEGEAG